MNLDLPNTKQAEFHEKTDKQCLSMFCGWVEFQVGTHPVFKVQNKKVFFFKSVNLFGPIVAVGIFLFNT